MKAASLFLSISILFLASAGAALASEGWTRDFDEALKKAQKEDLPILLDFSGSDWCGWCIRLDEEVFSKEAFKKWAKDRVVLCLLDFPRDPKKVSKEQRKKNKAVARRFNVRGYPTVLLLDSNGQLIARTGYRKGGAQAYIEHIDGLLDKCANWQERLASLKTLQGEEKVKVAAELMKNCSSPLGEKIVDVAKVVFLEDRDDSSNMRSDAALIVAGSKDEAAKKAEAYLKKTSKGDERDRYGFLLFTRTKKSYLDLLKAVDKNEGGKALKKKAKTLYEALKEAKKHVKRDEMAANIYLRMSVALACAGEQKKAKTSLERAAKLGASESMLKGYKRFVDKMK